MAKESYSLEDYWEPFLKTNPDKRKKLLRLIDEISMKNPYSLENSIEKILLGLRIVDQNLVNQVLERWKKSCDSAVLFSDVDLVLNSLRKKGYYLVLITNTSTYGFEALNKKFGLDKYFDFVIKSFEVGMVKPNTEIFDLIENKFSRKDVEFFMVGDSFKSDIVPARKRGWRTVQIIRDDVIERDDNGIIMKNLLELEKTIFDSEKNKLNIWNGY